MSRKYRDGLLSNRLSRNLLASASNIASFFLIRISRFTREESNDRGHDLYLRSKKNQRH